MKLVAVGCLLVLLRTIVVYAFCLHNLYKVLRPKSDTVLAEGPIGAYLCTIVLACRVVALVAWLFVMVVCMIGIRL